MIDDSNMVLRYYIGLDNHELRFADLVEFLKRTGIHRVVLFTAPFAGESSIFPEEYYRNHSEMLKPYMQKLKEMGVETGINSLYTVGHAYYADENEYGFQRAVTIDGEMSRGCVCMLDEGLNKYNEKMYRLYAELNPSVIYLDDDIRGTSLGQIVCLCDKHVELISKRVGRVLTRGQIKASILANEFEPDEIKKAFFAQLSEDIEKTIVDIADVIHSVSPDTKVGIMTISYPDVTLDRNLNEFFKRNYEKGIAGIRTGMGFYREGEHKDIPMAFSYPMIQRNLIDDDRVEIQPEIENDIYGYFYKSNSVTDMQITWCISNGLKNMQLNLFDCYDARLSNYNEVTDGIANKMGFYNKLTKLIPLNKRTNGVNIYANPEALLYKRAKNGQLLTEATWYKYLQVDGIPVGYDLENAKFIMFTGDDIAGASDSEIDKLLKKGAFIDLSATEVLVYRGFGERIGVKSISDISNNFAGERFTEHDFNGKYKNYNNSDYFMSSLIGNALVKDIKYYDGAELISKIVDHHKAYICNGVTTYENKNGERFCIIPTDVNLYSQFTNINNKRKLQLINIFEWIGKAELPVYACNEKVCININEFDAYNVITLFNLRTDDITAPSIAYKVQGELKYIDNPGVLRPLKYAEDGRFITLNKSLKAMGVMAIVDWKGCL